MSGAKGEVVLNVIWQSEELARMSEELEPFPPMTQNQQRRTPFGSSGPLLFLGSFSFFFKKLRSCTNSTLFMHDKLCFGAPLCSSTASPHPYGLLCLFASLTILSFLFP